VASLAKKSLAWHARSVAICFSSVCKSLNVWEYEANVCTTTWHESVKHVHQYTGSLSELHAAGAILDWCPTHCAIFGSGEEGINLTVFAVEWPWPA
jgi:hypothetical protein